MTCVRGWNGRKRCATASRRRSTAFRDTNRGGIIEQHAFDQFLFFRQWTHLKQYANDKGIRIIGDIPIYVAHDSSDVWSQPELFQLDERGQPTVVAGVPPDYFSETGQLWGNPIYRWDLHAKEWIYAWWKTAHRERTEPGGYHPAWTISAALPGIGKCPPAKRRPSTAAGCPDQARRSSRRSRSISAELPLIAEDLGVYHPGCGRPAGAVQPAGDEDLPVRVGRRNEDPFVPHNFRGELRGLHRDTRQRYLCRLVPQGDPRTPGVCAVLPGSRQRIRQTRLCHLADDREVVGVVGNFTPWPRCRTSSAWAPKHG